MNMPSSERYFRRKDAAAFLRSQFAIPTSTGYLAKLAVMGGGPPFHKFSRTPIYRESELMSWAQSRLGEALSSTSEFKSLEQNSKVEP